uniref:Large ribosomal subunit protein uL16m n=1 Tax=Monomastix sp. (strain OKE-1) TaxID=141716 RepID=U5YDP6_MONSK|nr:ribosomal protein L16 [Monomastix sp. OKE-1]AGZ90204.1 ribosomal protein L16 [Monomastix sp. OKE-1]
MLQPKRTKFRKFHKGKATGIKQNTSSLHFGTYGIKVVEAGRLSSQVIEAARRALTRKLRRNGQIWIRIFPDIAVSKKPAEVRMGKGKGAPEYWVARVQAGQILFEIAGVSAELAKQAGLLASRKIALGTVFIKSEDAL